MNRRSSSPAGTSPDDIHQLLLVPFGLAPDSSLTGLDRFGEADWAALIGSADVHGVLPALFTSPIADAAPPEQRQQLRSAYYQALTFHLGAIETIGRIAELFRPFNVRWAVVKGPVLSESCYPRPDLRPYSDVDVLVHPADFEQAVELLERVGGQVFERNWSLMTRNERGELAIAMPDGTVVDLHWQLLFDRSHRQHLRLHTPDLLARQVEVRLGQTAASALEPIDQLVHLFIHGGLAGGHRLRWSLDLFFGASAAGPWSPDLQERLRIRLRDTGANLLASVMSERAARMLGRGLPCAAALHRGGPVWSMIPRAIDTIHQPNRWRGGTGSGRLFIGATRSSTLTSLAALARAAGTAGHELASNPNHPWRARRRIASPTIPSIMHDDPTPGSRERYFSMAARVGQSRGD